VSTFDYSVRLRRKSEHEILAELLDFGLTHHVIDSELRPIAEEMMRQALAQLLRRKRLSADDERTIRARWEKYLTQPTSDGVVEKSVTKKQQVLAVLRSDPAEVLSPAQISELTGISPPVVAAYLVELHRRGAVLRESRGRYRAAAPKGNPRNQ
jgi:predicted Rossmann fold nucleotide-binding protein DprA/Smf involved in DNA uptake